MSVHNEYVYLCECQNCSNIQKDRDQFLIAYDNWNYESFIKYSALYNDYEIAPDIRDHIIDLQLNLAKRNSKIGPNVDHEIIKRMELLLQKGDQLQYYQIFKTNSMFSDFTIEEIKDYFGWYKIGELIKSNKERNKID